MTECEYQSVKKGGKIKKKRCPKGSRRDKKSGKCKKKSVSRRRRSAGPTGTLTADKGLEFGSGSLPMEARIARLQNLVDTQSSNLNHSSLQKHLVGLGYLPAQSWQRDRAYLGEIMESVGARFAGWPGEATDFGENDEHRMRIQERWERGDRIKRGDVREALHADAWGDDAPPYQRRPDANTWTDNAFLRSYGLGPPFHADYGTVADVRAFREGQSGGGGGGGGGYPRPRRRPPSSAGGSESGFGGSPPSSPPSSIGGYRHHRYRHRGGSAVESYHESGGDEGSGFGAWSGGSSGSGFMDEWARRSGQARRPQPEPEPEPPRRESGSGMGELMKQVSGTLSLGYKGSLIPVSRPSPSRPSPSRQGVGVSRPSYPRTPRTPTRPEPSRPPVSRQGVGVSRPSNSARGGRGPDGLSDLGGGGGRTTTQHLSGVSGGVYGGREAGFAGGGREELAEAQHIRRRQAAEERGVSAPEAFYGAPRGHPSGLGEMNPRAIHPSVPSP